MTTEVVSSIKNLFAISCCKRSAMNVFINEVDEVNQYCADLSFFLTGYCKILTE